jgi:hypothetical protein
MRAERQGFTIVTEVAEATLPELRARLARVQQDPGRNPDVPLACVPTHFAAFVVLHRDVDRELGYPPLLVFDVAHDGARRDYLTQLVAQAGPGLHAIYRHAAGYPGEGGDLARWLERHIVRASGAHLGYPGRSVRGLAQDAELRRLITDYLDSPRGRAMRASGPSARDARATLLGVIRAARRQKPHVTTGASAHEGGVARWAKLATIRPLGVPAALALLLLALTLRFREWRDGKEAYAPPTRPAPGPTEVQEDVQVQNHLTHLVSIRPGIRRALALRLVLYLVDQLSRFYFNRGALAGIPTIHFARWVILRGGWKRPARLLFLSNYDLSWDSYLGDFIDRSHRGLTGVWSHTRGFPPSRWIINDGARHEDAFKTWTRRHQLPEQVWYSSCPQQTVASVLADAALRDGLERDLDEAGARAWLTRL